MLGEPVVGLRDSSLVEIFMASGSIVSISTMGLQTFKAMLGNTLSGMQYSLLSYSAIVDTLVDACRARNQDTTDQPDPTVHTITSAGTSVRGKLESTV